MDYLFLQDFLAFYSLPTLIIATSVCVVSLTLFKFLPNIPKAVKTYLPFTLSIALHFAYESIFVLGYISFGKHTLYAGLLSGSLSLIISSTIKRISKGKTLGLKATVLLIEGLLEEYVSANVLEKTAILIDQVISDQNLSTELVEQSVVEHITNNSLDIEKQDATNLAKLIIQAVNASDKT